MFCNNNSSFFHCCCFKTLQQTTIAIKHHALDNTITSQKTFSINLCFVKLGAWFDSAISRKTSLHDIFAQEQFKFLTAHVVKMAWQWCKTWNRGSNQPIVKLKANADAIMVALFVVCFKKQKMNFVPFLKKIWNKDCSIFLAIETESRCRIKKNFCPSRHFWNETTLRQPSSNWSKKLSETEHSHWFF